MLIILRSREDHAVLEAEYQQNPKPDKITRASIVSRVSLGDKEVQVWPPCLIASAFQRLELMIIFFADMVSEPSTERSTKIETPRA